MKTKYYWIAGCLVLIAGLAIVMLVSTRPQPAEKQLDVTVNKEQEDHQVAVIKERGESEFVTIGGVRRKASDVRSKAKDASTDLKPARDLFDYGTTKPVPADLNPQVRSVAEAIREKKHPERVSVIATPQQFDAEAFAADSEKYLNTIEPGRVFQSAQPGKDVPRMVSASPYFHKVIQGGEPAILKVRAVPGAPVTFTSFDLGEFSNRLTSITVAADEKGVAKAEFYGTPGTIEDANILAGSPVTSGQVKFVVNVQLPEE